MKIINKEESREQCMEAGWYAYDYKLERELLREDILRFREFEADFIYLTSMKQPFYKIEDKYFMIKGTEGRNVFRLSMYKEYEAEICQKVESFLENI